MELNIASSWFSFTIAPEVCMRLFRISTGRTDISILILPSSGNYPGPVLSSLHFYKMLWKLDFNSVLDGKRFWPNFSPFSTPTTHVVLAILISPSEAFLDLLKCPTTKLLLCYFPYLCYKPSLCLIFTHSVQILFSLHTVFMFNQH